MNGEEERNARQHTHKRPMSNQRYERKVLSSPPPSSSLPSSSSSSSLQEEEEYSMQKAVGLPASHALAFSNNNERTKMPCYNGNVRSDMPGETMSWGEIRTTRTTVLKWDGEGSQQNVQNAPARLFHLPQAQILYIVKGSLPLQAAIGCHAILKRQEGTERNAYNACVTRQRPCLS